MAAIKALERAGFEIARQSGHVVMRKGNIFIVIPRANPIKPFTMGAIIQSAGLSVEEFKVLLK